MTGIAEGVERTIDRSSSPQTSPAQARLLSLDAFRGLTMAAMVIVNNPGDWDHVYWPLLHAEWHGWTPTDLIFPFFLFIVGISITLSRRGASPGAILRRASVLFGLGLFLNGFPFFQFGTWRIPGVLQRIAVCYLAAALLFRMMSRTKDRRRAVSLALWAAGLTGVHWLVMTHFQTPWAARGDLSPEGNLGAVLDRALMEGHLWKPRWDPEGLLSTVPAIATTLFGCSCGAWLRVEMRTVGRAARLALMGAAGLAAGLAWGRVFPINKNLWTGSYVLFTAGAAALTLALLHAALDRPDRDRTVRGGSRRRWSEPMVILGSNAIALFVLSSLAGRLLVTIRVESGRATPLKAVIYEAVYAPLAPPEVASLLYALTHLVVLYAALLLMYRRRVFLKV